MIIIPGCKTISVSNLKKITDFYNQGGSVIFTTRLPFKSSEAGKDKEINELVNSVFPEGEKETGVVKTNKKGGRACFISRPDGSLLRDILDKTVEDFDIEYPMNESLQYIHKIINGRNVFYFANIGGKSANTKILFRGNLNLEEWDPHTGESRKAMTESIKTKSPGMLYTRVILDLKPYRSCFYIETQKK